MKGDKACPKSKTIANFHREWILKRLKIFKIHATKPKGDSQEVV